MMTLTRLFRSLFSTPIALCFLLPTSAGAQPAGSQLKVEPTAECPSDDQLRSSFPSVSYVSAGIGTTIAKLGNPILDQSGDPGSEATYVSLPFNTELIVYGFNSTKTKLFVRTRLRESITSPLSCGWISTTDVLMPRDKQFKDRYRFPQPLQMRDITSRAKESKNLLNVKAVIHNLSITGDSKAIDTFRDPQDTQSKDKIYSRIRLFDTYLVFDQLHIPSSGKREDDRYWLLGTQKGDGTTDLKGWVRQKDVVIWPSRLAVQWNPDATVTGYNSVDDLLSHRNPIIPHQTINQIDFPDRITRRFPVLEQEPPPEAVIPLLPIDATVEKRRAIALNAIKYYKIATAGDACKTDDVNDCMSPRQADLAREQMVKVQKAARRMDVMILIDATESMQPYFATTVSAIQHFVKKASELRDEVDVRFGVSLYGDYKGQTASVTALDYSEIVGFFRAQPSALRPGGPLTPLLRDPNALVFKDEHRDKLEAPFAAIIRAAQTTKWRPEKEVPLRFLIHLADDGNRDKGKTSAETIISRYPRQVQSPTKSLIREKYGEVDVASALEKNNVIYVPVAVLGPKLEGAEVPIWSQLFKEQANEILRHLGERSPVKEVEVTYSKEPLDTLEKRVQKTVGAILIWLDHALKVSSKLEVDADCEADWTTERCREHKDDILQHPARVKLANRVAMVAAGLSPAQVKNIHSREQSIVTVYVPARAPDGKETFSHWVALEAQEFKELRELLTFLCDSMGDQDSRNPVAKAVHQFAQLYANEEFAGLSVAEILGKRLGIPSLERTDFSSRTRDEIASAFDAWRNGEGQTWLNWHLRICKAGMFTRLMEDNKKTSLSAISCDVQKKRRPECSVAEQDRKEFRWTVEVSTAQPVYYVPLDILP